MVTPTYCVSGASLFLSCRVTALDQRSSSPTVLRTVDMNTSNKHLVFVLQEADMKSQSQGTCNVSLLNGSGSLLFKGMLLNLLWTWSLGCMRKTVLVYD